MQEVFEKIIEKLRTEKNVDRSKVYSPEQCDAIRYSFGAAIDAVKVVVAEYNNGWIPCSGRFPSKEEFKEAYCRNKYGAVFIVMIEGANRPTTLYLTSDGLWVDDCRNVHEVLAWQPLPEPYQPKGE